MFGRAAVILVLTLFVAAAPAVSFEIAPEPEDTRTELVSPTPADGSDEGSEESAPPQRIEGPTFQRPGAKAERATPMPQRRVDIIEYLHRERDPIRHAPRVLNLPPPRRHVDLRAGLCALPPPAALLLPRR